MKYGERDHQKPTPHNEVVIETSTIENKSPMLHCLKADFVAIQLYILIQHSLKYLLLKHKKNQF